jgi:hypothetical protein
MEIIYHSILLNAYIIIIMRKNTSTSKIGIHRGEHTHHQLHEATIPVPVNFNTKNTTNIVPDNPRLHPVELLDEFDIISNCMIDNTSQS